MPWVIKQGLGKHIPARKPQPRFPFDVIGPAGQSWIEARWSETVKLLEAQPSRPEVAHAHENLKAYLSTRLVDLNIQGRVLWLRHHFPKLSDTEIARILDVTQQLVSRYARLQEGQIAAAETRKGSVLPDRGKVRMWSYRDEADLASGGARYITQAHNTAAEACTA